MLIEASQHCTLFGVAGNKTGRAESKMALRKP